MLVEFRSGDQVLASKALGIYRKGIEAAMGAREKVYAPTMELQTADSAAFVASGWIVDKLGELELGETLDIDIPMAHALAVRTASSVYLGQLGKLADKQTDLLVPTDETQARISDLQSLHDRLAGQTEIHSVLKESGADYSATVRVNGGAEMSMAEFADKAPDLLFNKKRR